MNTDDFSSKIMGALQDKAISMSGMASSSPTGIDESINKAIQGTQEATTASRGAIESSANREIDFSRGQLGQQREQFLEGGRGFATNVAALQNLDERTEKSLRDMEQRKQELLLQNDAAGASKVADLQLRALEFRENARQQSFTNMLGLGNLATSMRAEERAAKQFTDTMNFQKESQRFSQLQAMTSLATQFGQKVLPGDTLESVAARVQPMASAKAQAEIAKLLKDSQDANISLNTASYLTEALTGAGRFEGNALLPGTAAIQAATDLKAAGVDVTPKLFNQIVTDANKMYDQLKAEQDKAQAEESGKSIWSMMGSIFGPKQTNDLMNKAASKFNSSLIPDNYADQTAAFTGLFQR